MYSWLSNNCHLEYYMWRPLNCLLYSGFWLRNISSWRHLLALVRRGCLPSSSLPPPASHDFAVCDNNFKFENVAALCLSLTNWVEKGKMKFLLQVVRRPNQVSVAVTVLSVAKCQISWSFLICAFSSLINIFTSFNHFPSHYIFLNFFFSAYEEKPSWDKEIIRCAENWWIFIENV